MSTYGRILRAILPTALAVLFIPIAQADLDGTVLINEIRIDQPSN